MVVQYTSTLCNIPLKALIPNTDALLDALNMTAKLTAKLNTDNLLTLSITAKEQRSYTEHQRASENMKRD